MRNLVIDTPKVLPFAAVAIKGAHGGRGSGKSHFFAERMIEECLAVRSTSRSVHLRSTAHAKAVQQARLIEDKLIDFRLGEVDGFKVFNEGSGNAW